MDAEGQRLRSDRRQAFTAAGVLLLSVGALGALLLAPGRVASVRLGGLPLGWWGAATVAGVALAALALAARGHGARSGGSIGRPDSLALAAVWGSPALWMGLGPLVVGEGTAGLWAATAAVVGAAAAALVLGAPGEFPRGWSVASLARRRWPDRRAPARVLMAAEAGVAVLFASAQLAAVREIGVALGRPRAVLVSVTVAVVLAGLLPARHRLGLAALGGGAALAALALPVTVAALATGSAWGSAWSAVAGRPRLAFAAESAWTTEGRAVHGPGSRVTLRFTEAQRVTFVSPGPVVLTSAAGETLARVVTGGDTLDVHPGDRLVVTGGTRLRFEPGRRIPDAPPSGAEWAEGLPEGRRATALAGVGITAILGALGVAPAGRSPGTGGGRGPGARPGAVLVVAGVALLALGGLQAAWLAPEVYAGGVTGGEVLAALAALGVLAGWGPVVTWVVLAGLGAGVVGSLLAGPPAVALGLAGDRRSTTLAAGATGLGAASMLALASDAWTLLLAALALAGAVLAPAAVALAWSERATPPAVTLGASLALAGLAGVTLGILASSEGWSTNQAGWPAALVAPVHGLVLWLLVRRRGASGGAPRGLHPFPDDAAAARGPAR